MSTGNPRLPDEVLESMEELDESLEGIEDVLRPMLSVPMQDLKEKLEPLQCAKSDLVVAYTVNSLFWIYLTTRGINPRDHPIKDELDRIKKYMGKLKEISDKKNAAKLDKGAANRFIKSALWVQKKEDNAQSRKEHRRKHSKHRVDRRTKKS